MNLEQELKRHQGLVKRIAAAFISKLPANVELDDLIQAGMIGLMEVLPRYNESLGDLHSFIASRVRGAILDFLRESDYLSRLDRQRQKEVDKVTEALHQRFLRRPLDSEVAREIGITLSEYQTWLRRRIQLRGMTDPGEDENEEPIRYPADENADPVEEASLREKARLVNLAVSMLTEHQQQVLSLHYADDLSMSEISERLRVTVSSVMHTHTRAIHNLSRLVSSMVDNPGQPLVTKSDELW
jgi:RNA polymerase sigma factor for flagellar operon FliA